MKTSTILVLTFLLSLGSFSSYGAPDNKKTKKKAISAQENMVAEMKKSVQFNYGVPLPKETLTGNAYTTPTSEGVGYYNWIQKKFAEKMAVHPSEVTNQPLYDFIDDWYGTRYVYGGTSKRGIDCSSFVQKLIRATYNVDMQRTAANQHRTTQYVKKEDLKEGDLVFFKIKVHRISHVGVYLQNNRFVHASSSRGVMISNLNSSYWSRYYAGGGRVNM